MTLAEVIRSISPADQTAAAAAKARWDAIAKPLDSLGALESWYYSAILRGDDLITPEQGKALTRAVTAEQVQQLLQSYHLSVCYAVTAGKEAAPC